MNCARIQDSVEEHSDIPLQLLCITRIDNCVYVVNMTNDFKTSHRGCLEEYKEI